MKLNLIPTSTVTDRETYKVLGQALIKLTLYRGLLPKILGLSEQFYAGTAEGISFDAVIAAVLNRMAELSGQRPTDIYDPQRAK